MNNPKMCNFEYLNITYGNIMSDTLGMALGGKAGELGKGGIYKATSKDKSKGGGANKPRTRARRKMWKFLIASVVSPPHISR